MLTWEGTPIQGIGPIVEKLVVSRAPSVHLLYLLLKWELSH
jgi:hypothetical protein